MNWLFEGDFGLEPTSYVMLTVGILLAFAGGLAVAWTYMWTHSGISYSRSYTNTLIVFPVLVCMVMMVLAGGTLVVAFGLMAIFALVRFRAVLRDTLDTAYIFAVIVIGLACGTRRFTTAVIACVVTVGIMIFFWITDSGARQRFDVVLNFQWQRPSGELSALKRLFHRHCRAAVCASQRTDEGGALLNLSYHVRLRDPSRGADLIAELQAVDGVARVTSLAVQDESEI